MKIVDLFSGLGGFSQAFVERGHDVITLDLDPRFKPTIVADIREIRYPSLSLNGDIDVVLASPPCKAFSVASIPHHWKDHKPGLKVAEAVGIVANALRLIAEIQPTYWVLENPCGMLKRMIGDPKETIYLCSYGTKWKKPTDLWGRYPGKLKLPCAPHEAAPRGSKKGVQGVSDPAERAKLPYGLSLELCKRFENGVRPRLP